MPAVPALPSRRTTAPRDQAHGLRQLFAGAEMRFVPLVHNPHVPGAGAVMERLCAAFAALGLRSLVVDAADTASPPHELASVDLAACVEPLSVSVSYLAARGLPMQYLDSRATLSGFLEALRGAAPQADVVLLHAGALDLRRMFAGRTPRPVLLAGARPDSLTHAYTSMKLLSQRLGALAYDLVVAGDVSPRRARGMGDRLEECADHFLGAALRDLAVIDPQASPQLPLGADLRTLAAGLVAAPPGALAASGLAEPLPPPAPRATPRRPLAAGSIRTELSGA
jgi:flagellar biosynthesis protein FlhG